MLKAAGLTGTPINGEDLLKKVSSLEEAEAIDTLQGLVMTGFLLSDNDKFRSIEEVRVTTFRVNSSYTRDLRESISGRNKDKSSRRRRRG